MTLILTWLITLGSTPLAAQDVALTVDQFDYQRQRTTILVKDGSLIPVGTKFRIHTQKGQCVIEVLDQINNKLIGSTSEDCSPQSLNEGMELAYSDPKIWDETPEWKPAPQKSQTSFQNKNVVHEILDRASVFIGHNFARQLEGNVYNDGSLRDLRGGSALSLGVKGRVYDFNDRISLAAELGYESPRTMDRGTFLLDEETVNQGTRGFSPRLSLWSVAVQGEGQVSQDMKAFLGLNLSFPTLTNAPFAMGGAIGFQAGVNYLVWDKVALEGLVKITNMSLNNDIGQTTDVSLAGLEVRGRYTF